MRILSIIAGYSAGGAETLVRNLSKEFVARGHNCRVAAIFNAHDIGNCTEFEAAFERDLDLHDIGHDVIGGGRLRTTLLGSFRLRGIVEEFRPDILHAHTGHALLSQAVGLVKVPTVYTHHNIRMTFPRVLFWVFDQFVHRYIAICAACETMLRQHVRRPVERIYNGVPTSFGAGEPRTAPARDPTVLSVGTLRVEKDYPTLIRAAALCAEYFSRRGRRIRFQIAGSGSCEGYLRSLIQEPDMAAHVELLGTRADVGALMSEADLLASSSISEGFPITLIEAAMSGLPVVATDVGGVGEIVINGETGWLVPPGSPELLAERITALLTDSTIYSAFSGRARARSQGFSIQRCADEHLRLYEKIATPDSLRAWQRTP